MQENKKNEAKDEPINENEGKTVNHGTVEKGVNGAAPAFRPALVCPPVLADPRKHVAAALNDTIAIL